MKPLSGTTLAVAALLTSPALAGAAAGTLPLDVALERYLVAAGICWVVLALAAEWLWDEPGAGAQSRGATPAAGEPAVTTVDALGGPTGTPPT